MSSVGELKEGSTNQQKLDKQMDRVKESAIVNLHYRVSYLHNTDTKYKTHKLNNTTVFNFCRGYIYFPFLDKIMLSLVLFFRYKKSSFKSFGPE